METANVRLVELNERGRIELVCTDLTSTPRIEVLLFVRLDSCTKRILNKQGGARCVDRWQAKCRPARQEGDATGDSENCVEAVGLVEAAYSSVYSSSGQENVRGVGGFAARHTF